jgi:uncharacterized repeat protein (TIGR01451 family)
MSRRAAAVLTAMMIFGGAGAAPASAHQSPGNCLVNGIDLELAKSGNVFRQGDTITFTIAVSNLDKPLVGISCDITGALIGFNPPNADGKADNDLTHPPKVVLVPTRDYLNGFALQVMGTYNWVVNLNPGVTSAIAVTTVSGTLHDGVPDTSFAEIGKSLTFTVTNPVLHIDKVGSITAGLAPQNVTYTYVVRNDSTTPVPMNNVKVSDNLCANPTYVGGDNGDGLLSNSESWTFTCTTLHQAPGVYTNTAQACANSTVPGDTTRPVCSNQATWTVTLTKPAGGVKGAQAVKPSQKACVSVPTHLRLRARELTRVRVHVALNGKDIPGSVVKIRGVGISKSKKTGKHGIVTFRVRAKRSGRLTVSSDHCIPAARISVKPARRVVAPVLPQVTG